MGFTFRQFHIEQNNTAMKVGTDGVLLGAWADGCRNILDIGTGTGLIALMMAQRFPQAHITAIDIDKGACKDALLNTKTSPFANRIAIYNIAIQHLSQDKENIAKFDSIVCNPPFFINSLKSSSTSRTTARHTDQLSPTDLMKHSALLLAEGGILSIIIPAENKNIYETEGFFYGLKIQKIIYIKTTPKAKNPKRCLISFAKGYNVTREEKTVLLSESDGNRSAWYRNLTKDFYLK